MGFLNPRMLEGRLPLYGLDPISYIKKGLTEGAVSPQPGPEAVPLLWSVLIAAILPWLVFPVVSEFLDGRNHTLRCVPEHRDLVPA